MELKEFEQNFKDYKISTELISLKCFEDKFPNYSESFYLLVDDKSGIKTWSENEDFLSRLMPFAQANCTGSTYGIWNDGTDKTLNELPIVVFGDEGGMHIVAENILHLMQILTCDTEISVDFDKAYFYKDEDYYEESEDRNAYKSWLKENFGLDPIENPNQMIQSAQQKYKTEFDNWLGQYYKGE
jgi:hypothetical protein